MRSTKAIAFLLVFCMLSALLFSCNSTTNETSGTKETTTASTTKKRTSSKNPPANNYDKELPENPAVLPLYNGKKFDCPDIALGQKSLMHVAIKTDKNEYNSYLKALEADGYSFYTDNKIGNNLFATYTNDTHILNVMYLDEFKQTRVICDEKSTFSLPGLKSENVYEETAESSLTLLADEAVGWPGRMGYVYKLADGSFFIIDGGYTSTGGHGNSSKPYIMAVLEKYADDPNNITIAAWLITHTHSDHLGGFMDMAADEEITKRITVEKIIYNTPSKYMLAKQDVGNNGISKMPMWSDNMHNAIKNWNPDAVIKAHPGQVFHLRNLKLTIYQSQSLILGAPFTSEPSILYQTLSVHNDTSIVSMVDFMGKKTLYMGDSHSRANTFAVAPVYKTSLQADILQVAHHGYGDTNAGEVYKYVSPSIVFWPVCKQHYDGLNYDGSIYYENNSAYHGVNAIGFNVEHLFKDGITHYYHGGECITFSDFETWEGVRWDAVPQE